MLAIQSSPLRKMTSAMQSRLGQLESASILFLTLLCCRPGCRPIRFFPGGQGMGWKGFSYRWVRLDRIKRGDFLVRALLSLPRDLAMVFIGPDAGCRTEWEALSVELGVERAVHFLGEVSDDDLRAAYQSCAALVLASRYEGLPTVILEAMASGSPVVAAATGGTSCVIKHGENGLLFSYDDTSEFVAAVQRALAPGALAIAEHARRIVAAEYSWDVNIPKICNLYAFNPEMGEEGACALAQ